MNKRLDKLTEKEIIKLSYASPVFFINNFVKIYDSKSASWVPFKLWPFQVEALKTIHENNLIAILKARQLGVSWIGIAYIVWQMIFRPNSSHLIVSRREEEAKYLLSDERLMGMYERLPDVFKVDVVSKSKLRFALSNGSVVRALPSNRGDSYTISGVVLADEFDLVQDQNKLLLAVKPTVSAGGKLLLISKSNKAFPLSTFKRIWKSGWEDKDSPWTSLFFPWYARPDRDEEWYKQQVEDSLARTGTMDSVYENFPATPEEALQPYQSNKRFPFDLINKCFIPRKPIENNTVFIRKAKIYREPEPGIRYVIAADPAEGNPNSDYSAIVVMERDTGEQVAAYKDKVEISDFGRIVEQFSIAYNNAPVLPERNNHGHALILWLRENTTVPIIRGPDGKFGYVQNNKAKTELFASLANDFMDQNVIITDEDTFAELSNITGDKLEAPPGLHDDLAIAFALAAYARRKRKGKKRRKARTISYIMEHL